MQPPVGYPLSLLELARGICEAAFRHRYRDTRFIPEVRDYFGVRNAFAVSSGKAALTVILQSLSAVKPGRRKVVVPAYTCYALPSSVVKAGLDLLPCDTAACGFDYDYDELSALLDSDVLCVVAVHLFGVPSDIGRLIKLCSPRGIFVVEDAAQAMGGSSQGGLLGTLGDVGFLSLGRGKNVTCGSGGIIVTSHDEIADALRTVYDSLPGKPLVDCAQSAALLALLSVFIRPGLYWFPAGIPQLRLGETIFHEDFQICLLSEVEAAFLRKWPATLQLLNDVRREHSAFYMQHIRGNLGFSAGVPHLRFPVLLEDGYKQHVLGPFLLRSTDPTQQPHRVDLCPKA